MEKPRGYKNIATSEYILPEDENQSYSDILWFYYGNIISGFKKCIYWK